MVNSLILYLWKIIRVKADFYRNCSQRQTAPAICSRWNVLNGSLRRYFASVSVNIDVILLDLSLPDSQGEETFAKVKAGAPDIAIVAVERFGGRSNSPEDG